MTGNSFGKILQINSFGESHGEAVGGVLNGFPAGFEVDFAMVQKEVNRRRPGHFKFSSPRKEEDKVEFLSGIFEGKTLGTPIAFIVRNNDAKSKDYEAIKEVFRPSHADYSWEKKYGFRDYRGGGRSSARETLARVVAGALAQQYLEKKGVKFIAMVSALANITAEVTDLTLSKEDVDKHPLRCPDIDAEARMQELLKRLVQEGNTAGGVVSCFIHGLPAGLGEPVFDKFQARLAAAMMSINTAKGFEYGEGFAAATILGSEHNDAFMKSEKGIIPKTNHAGGVLGGITTGEIVNFNVAFKPIASLGRKQKTVDNQGNDIELEIGGRHDVTVLPRVVPIVEAMAALSTMDFLLMQKINQ